MTRAAADLRCDKQDVEVSEISECTYQALGCGKEATYVVHPSARDSVVCCPLAGCYATLDSPITKQVSSLSSESHAGNKRNCDSLPDDGSRLYKRGAKLIKPYIDPPDLRAKQSNVGEDDLRAGVVCLERALLLDPTHTRALWLRAKALQALGEHQRAAGAFAAAYKASPQNRDVAYEYVFELLAAGSFPEALSVAERAEQEHPNDVGILIHLALAQFLNHSLEQASRSVQRALELSAADTRAKALKRRIDEVIAGVRPPPRSLDDVEQSDG